MDVHDLRPETRAALAAVQAAQGLVRARAGAADVRLKGPGDVVTATDIAAQDAIEATLAAAHPRSLSSGRRAGWGPRHGAVLAGRSAVRDRELRGGPAAGGDERRAGRGGRGHGRGRRRRLEPRGLGCRARARRLPGGAAARSSGPRRPRSGLINLDLLAYGPGRLATFGAAFARQVLRIARRLGPAGAVDVAGAGARGERPGGGDGVRVRGAALVHFAAGLRLAEEAGARVTGEAGAPWRLRDRVFVVAASAELHEALRTIANAAIAELTDSST